MTPGFAEAMRLISADLEQNGGIDPGDTAAYVFPDGVVVVEMGDGRELKVTCIAGEPTRFDVRLDLLAHADEP